MKVTITACHLKEGRRRGPGHCPVALALIEATGKPCIVGTSGYTIDWGSTNSHRYHMSKRATNFILRFDKGYGSRPCTLELGRRRIR